MSSLESRMLLGVMIVALGGALVTGCASQPVVSEDAASGEDAALADDAASGEDAAAEPDTGGNEPDTGPTDADAGPSDAGPEPCAAEGMFRTRPCECGGTLSEQCVAGFWTMASPCNSNPVCRPGDFETRPPDTTSCFPMIEQRTCNPEFCRWNLWEVVRPQGECNPGSMFCDSVRRVNCDCQDDCTCQPIPGCTVVPL